MLRIHLSITLGSYDYGISVQTTSVELVFDYISSSTTSDVIVPLKNHQLNVPRAIKIKKEGSRSTTNNEIETL